MPTYPTDGPLTLDVDLTLGALRLTAHDGPTASVEVRPSNPRRAADVRDAEQTHVELLDRTLVVRAPRHHAIFGRGGSVDVVVAVPAGSDVDAEAAMADVHAWGRLGATRVRLAMGAIRLEVTGGLSAATGMGDVTVEHAAGSAEVRTGSGEVRIEEVGGDVVVKSSNGPVRLGAVAGSVRVRTANGDVSVGRADGAAVEARSANGDIRVLDVARGAVTAQTAMGTVEIGIREGTAAWLDVSSGYGHVATDLEHTDGPGPGGETLEVRARTSYGDVTVHRS